MNGVTTTMTYNAATNRLNELSSTANGSPVQDFVYGYDDNGNITSIGDNVGQNSQSFTYDWLNRLVTADGPYGNLTYNIDATGNVANPDTANSNYKQQPQELTYDYDNRVTSAGSTTFVYDYAGARVQKTTGNNVTTYVSRLYDIKNTNEVSKHIFAGGRRIASIISGTTYYHHQDHLGSLSLATNAAGNVIESVSYEPYGGATVTGADIIPYKFTGKELDSETGLYYFGARYYDPAQGRFMTPDTIVQSPGNPQNLNRYSYCLNNPLSFVDPTGHGFFSF